MFRSATKVYKVLAVFVLLFFSASLSATFAQSSEGQNFDDFSKQFKKKYFSVGALLQTVVDYKPITTPGDRNGFSISNARFQVRGEIDQKFGYQLQASVISSPAVLDANMYYNLNPKVRVKAGLFKAPFSAEYLTGAASIDFVNRSAVVGQLVPKRQIGLQVGGRISNGRFRYKVGMFNGNGFDINRNRDSNFLYVVRAESHLELGTEENEKAVIGLNASYEDKNSVVPGSNSIRNNFVGEQFITGVDGRVTMNNFMVSGEFIYSSMINDLGVEYNPFGYYLTTGYFVYPKTQLLVRWDSFYKNQVFSSVNDTESVLAGLNYFPTSYSEVQLNYEIPVNRDIEFSQVLLNMQINF